MCRSSLARREEKSHVGREAIPCCWEGERGWKRNSVMEGRKVNKAGGAVGGQTL